MQKSQFSFKKNAWLFLIIAAAFFVVTDSSCKSGKKSKVPTCVKMTKAQLQKWVKNGYTERGNKNYAYLIRLKTTYAFPGTGFSVFVMGQRRDGSLIDESLTELTPVDSCDKVHIKLSDFIFTGTNQSVWSDINVLNSNGTLIDSLEYLKLTPFDYKDSATKLNFMAYDFNVIKTGGVIMVKTATSPTIQSVSLPCPPCPNCKACPPPMDCTNCNPTVDTTRN
jgi:hypothetical protein